jgi:hypothetical protein
LPFVVKRLRWSRLAALPNRLIGASLAGLDSASAAALVPPWPDLVIAAGRRTAPVARWIKTRAPGCRAVQLMWPGAAAGLDLVVVPAHDHAAARANVAAIDAPPHRLTPERLGAAAVAMADAMADLPRPLVACLVGGARRGVAFGAAEAEALVTAALRLVDGGALLMLTSRRTGAAARSALARRIRAPHRLLAYPEAGEAVYAGCLGLAAGVIATADSASMLTEACAAGRPVHLFRPPGWRLGKLEGLLARLTALGYLRPLAAPLAAARLPPLQPAHQVAALIRARLAMPLAADYVAAAAPV